MCVDHQDRPVSSPSLTLSTAKKKREEDAAKRDANDRDISEFFKKGVSKAPAKPKVCRIRLPWPMARGSHPSRSSRQKKMKTS